LGPGRQAGQGWPAPKPVSHQRRRGGPIKGSGALGDELDVGKLPLEQLFEALAQFERRRIVWRPDQQPQPAAPAERAAKALGLGPADAVTVWAKFENQLLGRNETRQACHRHIAGSRFVDGRRDGRAVTTANQQEVDRASSELTYLLRQPLRGVPATHIEQRELQPALYGLVAGAIRQRHPGLSATVRQRETKPKSRPQGGRGDHINLRDGRGRRSAFRAWRRWWRAGHRYGRQAHDPRYCHSPPHASLACPRSPREMVTPLRRRGARWPLAASLCPPSPGRPVAPSPHRGVPFGTPSRVSLDR